MGGSGSKDDDDDDYYDPVEDYKLLDNKKIKLNFDKKVQGKAIVFGGTGAVGR